MKNTIPILFKIVRVSLLQLYLACVFSTISWAHFASGQNALSQKVSFELKNASVCQGLNTIRKSAGVKFIYNSKVFEEGTKISIKAHNEPLGVVLDRLLMPLNITYKAEGNQIVLSKKDGPPKESFWFQELEQILIRPTDKRISGGY